jgi:hypothetical protein
LQNDKLSKALSYALSELHARGFHALAFDWKELIFVNPGGTPSTVLAATMPETSSLHKVDSGKRQAASGSMMYLQNSVMGIKAEVCCSIHDMCYPFCVYVPKETVALETASTNMCGSCMCAKHSKRSVSKLPLIAL